MTIADVPLSDDEIVVLTAALDILRGKYPADGPSNAAEMDAFMAGLEIARTLTVAGVEPEYPSSLQRMAARRMLDADGRGRA